MVADGETRSSEAVGVVVPDEGQLKAQQSRAASTSGVTCCARALAQQSIPSFISCIEHSCSPECSGIPATVPPQSTAIMNEHVSHFVTARPILLTGTEACQRQ